MPKPSTTHKLLALDALRGVAACTVVLFHRASRMPFPKGYLAVDFFFMLSGFVLTFAYQEKLDGGWSTRDFLATRIARLYPLYLLGFVLGLLVALSDPAIHFGSQGWVSAIPNLLLLPAWVGPHSKPPHAFPYNIPAWSLFFEVVANVLHALFLRRRSIRFLTVITVISAAGLIARTGRHPIDFGANTFELFGGLLRVVFAYITGVVVCRIWKQRLSKTHVWFPVPAMLLLVVAAGVGAAKVGASFDLIAVIGVFPILLFLGASSRLEGPMAAIARELGAASYGVYILHQPVLQFLVLHGWSSPKGGGELLHVAASVCFVAGIFVSAMVIDRAYDAPARAFFRQLLIPKQSCRGA